MKWPFRRKQDVNIPAMPPEVQQYYQAEQRERNGVAWLLAGITLVVTVLVIMGLFFGGRYIYRKSRHNTNKGTVAQTTQTTSQPAASTESSSSSSTSTSSPSTSTTPAASSTPTTSTPNTTSSSQGVVGPTAARTEIPNTGPGDTVGLFIGTVVLGYVAHRAMQRLKV